MSLEGSNLPLGMGHQWEDLVVPTRRHLQNNNTPDRSLLKGKPDPNHHRTVHQDMLYSPLLDGVLLLHHMCQLDTAQQPCSLWCNSSLVDKECLQWLPLRSSIQQCTQRMTEGAFLQ